MLAVWITAAAIAVALGAYVQPAGLADVPAGMRALPRIQPIPADLRTLLFQVGVGSTFWYVAAMLLPVLWLGVQRLDLDRARVRTAAIIVTTMVALIFVTASINFLVVYGDSPYRPRTWAAIVAGARQNALPWLALIGLVLAFESRRRFVRSSFERERFRAEVAEQRVIALTNQLQPHFLFNTLQGISTLIHRDPVAADEMLARLSDLLRELLRHRDRVMVTLGEELQYVRTYLEIAQIRFADRLAFDIDVPSEIRAVAVPLFILQPVVENSLKHGIGARIGGGRVRISAVRLADRVRIEVTDDGPGQPSDGSAGIGLRNTRERLEAAFGANHVLALLPRDSGGAIARIEVPFAMLEAS